MIKVEHINKYYKNKQVLFDFSMNIEKNVIYGLVGPNGAGKTTFLKVLSGLLDYTDGSITVDNNQDYLAWCKKNIVFMPSGERGLRYKNTVYDNVMCFAALKGMESNKVKERIEVYSQAIVFSDLLYRRIETLSTGEKKKAMLLCCLCADMKIIIMDEPSNGLDIDAQLEMKELLKKLSRFNKKTFLISSHDMGFLSGLAEHYVFIFQGKKIVESDTSMKAEEIVKKYTRVKACLGD
ncbi:MAG: ABC transporter ATP-binding protein [Lachnospiraceae bacterium]|nr:ABC transporter ATP-binding protein [Lachnospiraceae bacterium]